MSDADFPDTRAKARWVADRLTARAKDLTVRDWLASLGVLCDCDNGRRTVRSEHGTRYNEPCDRCTLVEVGGIRVRANRGRVFLQSEGLARDELILPAVGVTE